MNLYRVDFRKKPNGVRYHWELTAVSLANAKRIVMNKVKQQSKNAVFISVKKIKHHA